MPAKRGRRWRRKEKEGAASARVAGQQVNSNKHWFSIFRFCQPLIITCGLWLPRQMYQAQTQSNLHVGSSPYPLPLQPPLHPPPPPPRPPTWNNLSMHPELRTPGLREGSHPSPRHWGEEKNECKCVIAVIIL